MTEDILPPPVWVDEQSAFQQLIAKLSAESRIAVDTESNSLHAYRERVCLIQFSTPDTDFLVDPFSIRDMSPLAPFFDNPAIEKIFHAAEYDLVCLRRDFGFKFTKLFDTMQAARILGYPFVGLDNILLEKFDIKIDKRHQKADWGARPLTPQQIDYARQDTRYLFQLRDLLEGNCAKRGAGRLHRRTSRSPPMWTCPRKDSLAHPSGVSLRAKISRPANLPSYMNCLMPAIRLPKD
jgi:ribonuclease D